ncbi:MAG: GAF domain-containing protein [Nitrosotalea sp.]
MMKEQFQEWLGLLLADIGAIAGTVHLCEGQGLRLAAAVNIPEVVQQAMNWVPSGKGMAGLALERGEPIKTCNLSDDRSGNVRPGAKAVNAKAAVAIPIRNRHGTIVAVVGVAFPDERDIGYSNLQELADRASSLLPMVPVE